MTKCNSPAGYLDAKVSLTLLRMLSIELARVEKLRDDNLDKLAEVVCEMVDHDLKAAISRAAKSLWNRIRGKKPVEFVACTRERAIKKIKSEFIWYPLREHFGWFSKRLEGLRHVDFLDDYINEVRGLIATVENTVNDRSLTYESDPRILIALHISRNLKIG